MSEELSLTNEKVVPILKKYHKNGIFDFMGFTEEILAIAKPIIEKQLRAELNAEIRIELGSKAFEKGKEWERKRISALIDTKKDLVHEGYHGYAGETPNLNCKGCQIEQTLKGEK